MDKIDAMIQRLNIAMDGRIEFDRDAVDTDRPEEWGAVALRKDQEILWADGRPIDTQYLADIYLSVSDRESEMIERVNDAMDFLDGEFPIVWKLNDRVWLADIERALWIWNVRIWGPLELPEEDEDNGEAGNA